MCRFYNPFLRISARSRTKTAHYAERMALPSAETQPVPAACDAPPRVDVPDLNGRGAEAPRYRGACARYSVTYQRCH